MIEWKQYDKDNPPALSTDYLVFNGTVQTAWLEYMGPFKSGPIVWKSDGFVKFVTHYAEINLPQAIVTNESA